MNILVRNSDNVVMMIGDNLTQAQVSSQYLTWVDNYQPDYAFTVYENVIFAAGSEYTDASYNAGYLDECWTYVVGRTPTWVPVSGREVDILEALAFPVEAPTNLTYTISTSLDTPSYSDLLVSWTSGQSGYLRYEVRYRKFVDVAWISPSLDTYDTELVISNLTPDDYTIGVRAYDVIGSNSVETTINITIPVSLGTIPEITGLEIYGQGSDIEFDGTDCQLHWNRTVPNLPNISLNTDTFIKPYSWFQSYQIKAYDYDNALLDVFYSDTETFNYTRSLNSKNGTHRYLIFHVRAMSVHGGLSEIPAILCVENPPPPSVSFTLEEKFRGFSFNITPSTVPDLLGYTVHASLTAGFTPSIDNRVYMGSSDSAYITKFENGSTITPGQWYIKIAAFDIFGPDLLTYTEQTIVLESPSILPNELYTTARVDFLIQYSIFFFGDNGANPTVGTKTTLYWSAGYVVRDDVPFALLEGNLPNAIDSYIIATLSGSSAVLSVIAIAGGLPYLTSDKVIIGTTSAHPNSAGNHIAYIRQANSMLLEGANIRDLTVQNAHIVELHGNKIMADTLVVGTNVLMGSGAVINWSVTTPPTATDVGALPSSTTVYSQSQIEGFATTITTNTVTTAFVDALAVTAVAISATTLTGKTIQTADTGKRFVVSHSDGYAHFYNDSNVEMCRIGFSTYSSTDDTIIKVGSLTAPSGTRPIVALSSDSAAVFASSENGCGVTAVNNASSANATAIYGEGLDRDGSCMGVHGYANGLGSGVKGVSFLGDGVVGYAWEATKYDIKATGAGINGPFTGAHDGMVLKSFVADIGDILVDDYIFFHQHISSTIAVMSLSNQLKHKGVVGVLSGLSTFEDIDDITALSTWGDARTLNPQFTRIIINSVGEGQINVCKDGGNIEVGDFICSSSRVGKGMKQDDGLLHNYTVAKARESVIWVEGEEDIRMIACTYHCG